MSTNINDGEFTQFTERTFGNLVDGDFIFLREGKNSVLVISDPYFYKAHWAKNNFGNNVKFNCMVNNCILCSKFGEPKDRWFIQVYSVEEKRIGIIDVPYTIIKGMHDCKEHLKKCVIEINRGLSDDGFVTYDIVANTDREITEAHRDKIRKMMEGKRYQMEEIARTPTLEEVMKRLQGVA